VKLSRRAFLAAGTAGVVALAAGGWLRYGVRRPVPGRTLDADSARVVAALVPAFLSGALPASQPDYGSAVAETVDAVDAAIAGLPPAAQQELGQLFGLLAFPPARIALTGLWSSWERARTSDVQAALQRWQSSRSTLLRSAYDGLHQIILAAWYGNPRAWPAIGYPGPPSLA
jgi:hypothetical protein